MRLYKQVMHEMVASLLAAHNVTDINVNNMFDNNLFVQELRIFRVQWKYNITSDFLVLRSTKIAHNTFLALREMTQ